MDRGPRSVTSACCVGFSTRSRPSASPLRSMGRGDGKDCSRIGSSALTAAIHTVMAKTSARTRELKLSQIQLSMGLPAGGGDDLRSNQAESAKEAAEPTWKASLRTWTVEGGEDVLQPILVEPSDHAPIVGD